MVRRESISEPSPSRRLGWFLWRLAGHSGAFGVMLFRLPFDAVTVLVKQFHSIKLHNLQHEPLPLPLPLRRQCCNGSR